MLAQVKKKMNSQNKSVLEITKWSVSSTNKTDRHDITVLNFLTLQDKHIIRTLSGKIKLICTRLETNRNK
jgi:hypothetical protein